jgi:hypothetical protein
MALQNILAQDFSTRLTDQLTGEIPPLERRLNAGVGLTAEGMGIFKPTLSVELRDMLIESTSILEHLSIGLEMMLKPKDWFTSYMRLHFYKGNIGGGIAGKLLFGELEVGTYAVNLGRGVGVGVDRRVYLAMSASF